MVKMENLPQDVKDRAEEFNMGEDEDVHTYECAFCNDTLYELKDGMERHFVDRNGEKRGSGIQDAVYLEDTYSMPADLSKPDNQSVYACGWCVDVDDFEKNGVEFVIVPEYSESNEEDLGFFLRDGVIDTHYRYGQGHNWRQSPFEDVIFAIARSEDVEEYGYTRYTGDEFTVEDVKRHNVEFDFDVIAVGNTIYVPNDVEV